MTLTFTTTELAALREAFEKHRWGPYAIEPDARITVLYEPRSEGLGAAFLVRHQHGWLWASGAQDAEEKRPRLTPCTWKTLITVLRDTEFLRLPTDDELRAGGWEIEEGDQSEAEEKLPLSTSMLIGAVELLEREGNEPPMPSHISEATAMALTSIAATMHDLSVLLEDEFAWRRSQRPAQGAEVEEGSDEQDSAHRSQGPGEDPNFSYSGR